MYGHFGSIGFKQDSNCNDLGLVSAVYHQSFGPRQCSVSPIIWASSVQRITNHLGLVSAAYYQSFGSCQCSVASTIWAHSVVLQHHRADQQL